MIDNIFAAGFLIGLVLSICYVPAVFAEGVYRLAYNKLTPEDKIVCRIPFYNTIKAEKEYTGKSSRLFLADLVLLCAVVFRFIVWKFLRISMVWNNIAAVFLLASILFTYAVNVWLVFIIIKDSETDRGFTLIAKSLVFVWGQYYIGTMLPVIMHSLAKREETFK